MTRRGVGRIVPPTRQCIIAFRHSALLVVCEVDRPFDALWFIEGPEYWALDLDMDCRRNAAPIRPSFVGWHNLEVFALAQGMRHKHCVGAPAWWVPLEPLWVLLP